MSHWVRSLTNIRWPAGRSGPKGGGDMKLAYWTKIHGKPKMYAGDNDNFKQACEKAGIPATRRQFSKWERQRGQAWSSR